MPRYDGKYTPLQEHPFCNACGKERSEVESLSRCSRCKMVWYCSVACQKSDFAQHKGVCRNIASKQAHVDREATALRNFRHNDDTLNLFEFELGTFWAMPDTRPYMRACMALCEKQLIVTEQVQTREAWTVILDHHLELLRLCAGDNMGLRIPTPFLLLRLNRDDDAYCFCRHWLGSELFIGGLENTLEGDWIYPREENSRFRDITQEFGGQIGSLLCDISSLLALAFIKMRLVAMYDSRLQELGAFDATNSSQFLGPDEQVEVRGYIVGSPDHEQKLADQRRQLHVLLDMLHGRNPSIVPALLHPEPLQRLPRPSSWSMGAPSEARMVLDFALDVWRDIPGSDRILQARFGTSIPSYPT